MLEMIALTEFLGDEKSEKMLWESYNKMKDRVNEVAWDGEWYLRYFDSDGQPLGSKDNNEGKIFTNAQSWSIISGFAPQERGIKALNSVNQYLNTPKGLKLSTPGYDGYDPTKGGVSTYPPGAKENGGIFLHTNPWVIIAEAMMGNGNRAFEYYNQINPARKNHIIDEYECEPYVYPQNILGDEHPQFGLARNHWLTGTASWIYQAATQFILGIQPSFKGLRIDPCIPSEWSGFKIIRKYRGAIYDIRGNNPSKISKGVKSIVVDGKEITGNLLPVFGDGKTHSIIVTLGNIPAIAKKLL
jgi:cellobiose phosphorylase